VRFNNSPKTSPQLLTLAKISGWSSGLSWFLFFSVILTDQFFGIGESGSDAVVYLCIGPLFVLSLLGFLSGIITGLAARWNKDCSQEDESEFAANGIKYGLLGISFVIFTPMINRLIAPTGIQFYDILALFGQ
jgi:hypothetical protein